MCSVCSVPNINRGLVHELLLILAWYGSLPYMLGHVLTRGLICSRTTYPKDMQHLKEVTQNS